MTPKVHKTSFFLSGPKDRKHFDARLSTSDNYVAIFASNYSISDCSLAFYDDQFRVRRLIYFDNSFRKASTMQRVELILQIKMPSGATYLRIQTRWMPSAHCLHSVFLSPHPSTSFSFSLSLTNEHDFFHRPSMVNFVEQKVVRRREDEAKKGQRGT